MKLAGTPVSCCARTASAQCCRMKSRWASTDGGPDSDGVAAVGAATVGAGGAAGATPVAGVVAAGGALGSWRASWRAIRSDSPVPLAAICWATCWSSMPRYISCSCESSSPERSVASRMLFITICMKSASNCVATFFTAWRGSSRAARLSSSSERLSAARPLATCPIPAPKPFGSIATAPECMQP